MRRRRARKPGTGKTAEVVEQGGRGGERGKNRDASDWHEGLRLLAALRQLGGVRQGIEIANAHYGYFPIEGRIPLSLSTPLSYHASRSFLFRSLCRRTAPTRDTSLLLAFALVFSKQLPFTPSLFRSLHASAPHSSPSPLSFSTSLSCRLPRIVFRSISPHPCLLSYRPARLPFSSFSLLVRTLRSRSPRAHRFPRAFALRKHTLESVHTVVLISPCPIPSYL